MEVVSHTFLGFWLRSSAISILFQSKKGLLLLSTFATVAYEKFSLLQKLLIHCMVKQCNGLWFMDAWKTLFLKSIIPLGLFSFHYQFVSFFKDGI